MSVGAHLPDIFPPSNLLDMFALAQHYGISTRLLDWTVKPLIAAYFAAIKVPIPALDNTPRFAVWALERDVINRCLGCETWLAPREDSIVAFLSAPAATNPNLAAQGGLFTLVQAPARLDVPSIDGLVDRSHKHIAEHERPAIYKFTLPANQAPYVLRLLEEHHVHAGSIFPGLAGVVTALKDRTRYT